MPRNSVNSDPRPDRVGTRYTGTHLTIAEHRRFRILMAKLGWTMDFGLRFAIYEAFAKLEPKADTDEPN